MKKALFWFRRDLRLDDNCALFHCLNENDMVAPVFIFDKNILANLPKQDKRVEFIWNNIKNIKSELNKIGSDLIVNYAKTDDIVELAKKYKVSRVYCNHDYEPQSIERDNAIKEALQKNNIEFRSYKDIAIFEKNEVIDKTNQPYHVFTQYKKAWKQKLESGHYISYPSLTLLEKMAKFKAKTFPSLEEMGFEKAGLEKTKILGETGYANILFERFKKKSIVNYKVAREYPSINGTSFLSVHNRFGTISIRKLVRDVITLIKTSTDAKKESCEAWLDELIWRDFYFQILFHYPHIAYEPFKPEFKNIEWENNMLYFQKWCDGQTGYPIIDAAMTQLNTTGYMHNRMRMLVSSFLTKILLIDYRFGEEYFATKLLDFELSSNNGGWQWAASSGCDAQVSNRIFSPIVQSEKFDEKGIFIQRYLPVLAKLPPEYLHHPWDFQEEILCYGIEIGKDYPLPIVNYKAAREKALSLFSAFESQVAV
jgi:deoxyribodipyrimidine photo-lyase